MDPDPTGRWMDSSLTLAEGRVLATPVDSDELHCLNLIDGKLMWKEPRGDDLFLACVHRGKVILVGRDRVRALNLHKTAGNSPGPSVDPPSSRFGQKPPSGKRPAPAWEGRSVEFPPGVMPGGTGFASGSRYYVPLTSGNVTAVDLETGRRAEVFASRRENLPGNLVCYKGKILSQSAAGLEAFHQLATLREEVRRRLAMESNDAEALALDGEIAWTEGRLQEAIDAFRRSSSLQPDPNTRQLLREAFLEGLRDQFDLHRGQAAEIERLMDTPQQRATYLRLTATGLAAAGEFTPALEEYWKLIELDRRNRGLEAVEKSHSVRRDRWIQVQLAALHRSASPQARDQIDRVAESRAKAAAEQDDPQALEQFLDYFGDHPTADHARDRLTDKLQQRGRWLAAELLLRRQQRSGDARVGAAAVADLADVLRRFQRWQDAAVCFNRLRGELADVVCRDEKTGRELVEALPPDDPVSVCLRSDSPWPLGKVEVSISKPKKMPPSTYNQMPLPFDGGREPFFTDSAVELHQNPLALVGRDGLGADQWRLSLAELARKEQFLLDAGMMRLSACGHLLLVASGQGILAVDTLGRPDDPSPQILWTYDLDEPGTDPTRRLQFRVQMANFGWGFPQTHLARQAHYRDGSPSVLTEHVLCFKRFRSCIAVDPATGETLWVRRDVPRDAELFGDRQYIFIVRPGKTTATVLRAADGHVLGQREVPLNRQFNVGRRVVVWRADDGQKALELVDPWDGSKAWPTQTFPGDATLRPVDDHVAAVRESDGRFLLVSLRSGQGIVDAVLPSHESFPELLVLGARDQYLVIAYNRNPRPNHDRRTQVMPTVSGEQVSQGHLMAFDRDGNALWPSPVTVEDQWLPLAQPRRLPVLTFACRVQKLESNGRMESKTSIICIDKRNGRTICREEFPVLTNSFRVVGDLEKKTVELRMKQNTITMTFTDRPLDPKPPNDPARAEESTERGPKPPSPAHAVLEAIRRALVDEP
jgi:tetratricopeptide (TPR) repeat protein